MDLVLMGGEWVLIAIVMAAAIPLIAATIQFGLIGLHGFRGSHLESVGTALPNVAIVIPAWNEGAVIGQSIERLLALDYPEDALRIFVVDDASTDETPDVVRGWEQRTPGRVFHLRREKGGEGKAHTLNHGLARVLDDDWAQAVLIIDADVIYEPDSLRRMSRHLSDPRVGAVTAYIKEGSRPARLINRFIAYEYITAQAAARRGQNVLGAMACLAGGAQLLARDNLEAIGGRIDTHTLAEDTVTTFATQLSGRTVVFDGTATVWAEEPASLTGLWKQRLRWARGNVQVSRRFSHVWFRRSGQHGLGGWTFGVFWFCILLLPAAMIAASLSLVTLYFSHFDRAWEVFQALWIVNAVTFVFITTFALLIDPSTGRRTWVEALMFPGAISLLILVYTAAPAPVGAVLHLASESVPLVPQDVIARVSILIAYAWLGLCMAVAWIAKEIERSARWRRLSPFLLQLAGYGPLLCAVTVAAVVKEARGAEMTWDKTEKTGAVAAR